MRVRIALAMLLVLPMASAATSAAGQSATRSPLDVRVTIQFRAQPALDVLRVLGQAARLTLDLASGELLPVTIALTNVRLETALTAVCENAGCQWTWRDRTVLITPVAIDADVALPRAISIALTEASLRDVFVVMAATLNLELSVEGELPDKPVTITFNNAPPGDVLNFLAQVAQCAWQLEPGRLTIRRLR